MNRGTLPGAAPNSWKTYTPRLLCAANGAVTHPARGGTAATSIGRWLRLADGLIVAEIQMVQGTGTTGTGSCYVIDLPYPAARPWDGVHVIGSGLSYQAYTPEPWEHQVVVALADDWTSLDGSSNNYVQMYSPYIMNRGTGTWSSGTTNTSFAHGLYITPNPGDVEITPTSGQTGGNPMFPVIVTTDATNVTMTSFGSNTIGTTDVTYSWRVRCEPRSGTAGSWLLGPSTPWPVTFLQDLFIQVYYEPA